MGAITSTPQKPIWTILAVLAALFATAIYQLAQPPTTHLPKVFVIGLSKTGTTSIGDALERIGYRRLGWRDIRSRHLVHTWAHSNNSDLSTLISQTKQYDAFEDLPWAKAYPQMAELYPDTKFILSLRKDDETWLRSMGTHMGRGEWQPYKLFYGATTFEGNEEVIRQSYLNHTREVREFFRDKEERFVEMRIDDAGDEENWSALCQVARCPGGKVPSIRFPRTNSKGSWDMGPVKNAVRFCWGWTVTRTEEQVVKYYYDRNVEAVKPVLSALWSAYDFVERAYTELEFKIVASFVPALTVE
ncbi:hypothetical protein CKM354_000230800 [Cercospora kikuchii]|uniref:P-loop containing nucleoside triphosphate hydrolase protein n=1 Tax=Cercospora kikuchii TaxID=84275 RepID=A0A9P3FDL1_9PEZI|nr:uncharacterized protein CKM354_000230800 [Cercospora kikuchii]GIZ38909.1 hypothetical protein CKM354_000230800 [Cercospora kikuchii]